MGAHVTFDSTTKIIQVDTAPVDGIVHIDVKTDIYSDGKEDWKSDNLLNKFEFPVAAVGGDPLPGSKSLGSTFFLEYGWIIRPYEASHTLAINGNMYARDGSNPYANTVGSYNVQIIQSVSNLVDSTVQQLSEIEYGTYQGAVWIDVLSTNSGSNYPVGNVEYPVNNLEDALLIIADRGFIVLQVIGNLTTDDITHNISDLHLIGVSHINSVLTIGPNTICDRTRFSQFDMTGTLDGDSEIRDCIVRDLEYFNGHVHNSLLVGTVKLRGSKNANIDNCSVLDILDPPTIDAGGSGQNLMMPNFTGRLLIDNLTGDSQLGIGIAQGDVIINDTCTSGVIALSGSGEVFNNASPGCYVIDKVVNGTDMQNLQRIVESLRPHHTGTGNVIYWGPDTGNDVYDGAHPDRAFKTWARVDAEIIDNNHDIVMLVPDASTGNTNITEAITVSKNYVFIRGPGRDVNFVQDSATATISVTGNGVELSGFRITNHSGLGVHSTAAFTMLDNIWLESCQNGAHFTEGYPIVQNTKVHKAQGYALRFEGDISNGEITNVTCGSTTGNAIEVDTSIIYGGIKMKDSVITQSQGYGVTLSATTHKFIIFSDCTIVNNNLGDVYDLGIDNTDGSEFGREIPQLKLLEHCIYLDTELVSGGDGSQRNPFGDISDAIDEAERLNIHHLVISSSIDIDRNIKNFIITGIGTPTVDTGGFSLDGCEFNRCTMRGSYTGTIIAQESHLSETFTLNGTFEKCSLSSTFIIPDQGYTIIMNCSTVVADLVLPTIDLGGLSGTASLIVSGQRGGLKLINSNQATDSAKLNMATGNVLIDSTCTAGTIVVSGIGTLVDNSIGKFVIDAMIDSVDIHDLHAASFNKRDNIANTITIYEEDEVTPRNVFDTNADLSVITPQ